MLSGNLSDDEMLPPVGNSAQRKSIKNSSQSNTNEIIKAYQVTAYKYIDSKYESRGKIGLALLGSKLAGNFNILLYGKGNSALAQANINKDFDVTSARELYISFYDVKSENWSILFDAMDIYNDFFNRISILKLVSSKQDMISMDVKIGEGMLVHDSDLCEAEIVVSSVKNCDIVSTLYSSENQETNKIIRLKIGANKLLPAIDKGISGMMKGGQRILAVSSQSPLLKGGSIKVATDTNILINVKIVRIKTKTEKPSMSNECGDSELSLPNLNFTKESDFENSDQSKKTELLNKMKRLGQPIVKFNVLEESDNSAPKSPESFNYTQSNAAFVSRPPQISNVPIYDNTMYNNQMIPMHTANPIMTAMQHMYPPMQPPTIQSMAPDNNLVFTETRQHNTEMRIAISKLQDKIDRIADKLDNSGLVQKQPVGRHMDAENVFENIKRIIDENDLLKRECSQKSDTIDSQNKRINELLNKSQKYLEESRNVIERSSVSFSNNDSENQRKILKLEEEKLELIRSLSKKTSELSQLEMKTDSLNSESQGYRNKSLEFTEQLNKLSTELGDLKLRNRSLLTEIEKLNEERTTVISGNEELVESKRQAQENERKLQNTIETLKNSVREANSNIELVRKESDNEIMEIRQRCNGEIEQLREKLKQERRIVSSKSSNLESELESVNREWEAKFDELKQSEAAKLVKLNERNSQLMADNSGLGREIFDLKDQLSVTSSAASIKYEELSGQNKQLQRQLDEARARASEDAERRRLERDDTERELTSLRKETLEVVSLKQQLQTAMDRKRQLESMVQVLTDELSVKTEIKLQSGNEPQNVEGQIKLIMNDIFKKIKSEFEVDRSYSGKEVSSKCMVIIRDSTVSIMKRPDEEEEEGSSDDDEEEEESSVEEEKEGEPEEGLLGSTVTMEVPREEVVTKSGKEELDEIMQSLDRDEIPLVAQSPEDETTSERMMREDNDGVLEYEETIDIVKNNDTIEIRLHQQDSFPPTEDMMQYNNANMNVTSDDNVREMIYEDTEQSTGTESHDKVPDNDDKIEVTEESAATDLATATSAHMTDQNLPKEWETKWDTDSKDATLITDNCDNVTTVDSKNKDALFSSDEDEDISGFFEQLNQKKKAKVEQTKNPVSSELDDDLSWLHS